MCILDWLLQENYGGIHVYLVNKKCHLSSWSAGCCFLHSRSASIPAMHLHLTMCYEVTLVSISSSSLLGLWEHVTGMLNRAHKIEIFIIRSTIFNFCSLTIWTMSKCLHVYMFLIHLLNWSVLHYHERGPPECDRRARASLFREVWCMAIGPGDQD